MSNFGLTKYQVTLLKVVTTYAPVISLRVSVYWMPTVCGQHSGDTMSSA